MYMEKDGLDSCIARPSFGKLVYALVRCLLIRRRTTAKVYMCLFLRRRYHGVSLVGDLCYCNNCFPDLHIVNVFYRDSFGCRIG